MTSENFHIDIPENSLIVMALGSLDVGWQLFVWGSTWNGSRKGKGKGKQERQKTPAVLVASGAWFDLALRVFHGELKTPF